jgi:MSHA pilin protein MshA
MKSVEKMKSIQSAKSQQSGFTLIELIMVIVILGVLASFALPKFADLSDSAKASVMEGVKGSVRSASALTHAQWLAGGGVGTSVTMEDASVVDLSSNGYILSNAVNTGTTTITNLEAALDIDGDLVAVIGYSAVNSDSTIITYLNGDYPADGSLCVIFTSTGAAAPTVSSGSYTDVAPANPTTGTFDADHASYVTDTCT